MAGFRRCSAGRRPASRTPGAGVRAAPVLSLSPPRRSAGPGWTGTPPVPGTPPPTPTISGSSSLHHAWSSWFGYTSLRVISDASNTSSSWRHQPGGRVSMGVPAGVGAGSATKCPHSGPLTGVGIWCFPLRADRFLRVKAAGWDVVQEATMPLSTRLFSTEKVPESHLPSKSTNLYLPLSALRA